MSTRWTWPGSRWWKCDLHLHTPESYDFVERETVAAEAWISAAQAQGLEVVAVTDHNSGRFFGKIPEAARRAATTPVIFPGVELTVHGGIHLLVLFGPGQDGEAVTALLGRCEVPTGAMGREDALTACSFLEALSRAAERGGVCIAAHADAPKGVLKVLGPGQTLQQILTSENLHAVEISGDDPALLSYLDQSKDGYVRRLGPLAKLTFSDAHSLDQIGRRFTWIKMTRPDLEGLRLALEDGPLSVREGNDIGSDPNRHAAQLIESIQVQEARYMGRGQPLEVAFNPWLNAIIGGRGTGKSSLLEFLRIALRRDRKEDVPEDLLKNFETFKRIPKSRADRGALTSETRLSLTYRKDGARFRICWDEQGRLTPIEQQSEDGSWARVGGEVRRRFPVSLYSQKQIFELAEEPGALLRIVDEAPGVDRPGWNERWRMQESRFLALRAKMREIEIRLGEEGRLRAASEDVARKLAAFESAGHSDILRRFQLRSRQQRALEAWGESFQETGRKLRELAEEAVPPDLEVQLFSLQDPVDQDVVAAVQSTLACLLDLRKKVEALAEEADAVFEDWRKIVASSPWHGEVLQAEQAYQSLLEQLRGVGAGTPDEYGRLVQERQALERRLADIDAERKALEQVRDQAAQALEDLTKLRAELTRRRAEFLRKTLEDDPYIRIEVIPYGEDEESGGRRIQQILGTERFRNDILMEDGQGGLVFDLYKDYRKLAAATRQDSVQHFEKRLAELKRNLEAINRGEAPQFKVRDRRFQQFVAQLNPEVLDRLAVWFPEDSLRVSHRTDGGPFRPIEQGSPGQKAAAILAFLLSYGEEPMVLDQPEDDLDNQLISDLLVQQLRENKPRRQFIVVTHNPNVVVNGDAELVLVLDFRGGQTRVAQSGGLQELQVRDAICRVMEGGQEALERRYRRIGRVVRRV
jgi:energy-coupling factor transporter ATP-binding protein EcfA2